MDAANMLKPALARGELRCIGATTLDEYRKHIEKDAALERRFQPVMRRRAVGGGHHRDPARPQGAYEVHHGVRIQDAAMVAAAMLSHRYIADRFLPDKAIDLIDEAAARSAWRSTRMPHADRRDRAARSSQLEIEREALKREKDKPRAERLARSSRAGRAAGEGDAPQGPVAGREGGITQIGKIKEDIDAARQSMAEAERKGDLNRAAELRFGVIPGLETAADRARPGAR